jgi:hypothetical protein
MAIAVIPFALSWLLKEVPLRTTLEHPEVEPAAAPAGAPRADTRPEPIVPRTREEGV